MQKTLLSKKNKSRPPRNTEDGICLSRGTTSICHSNLEWPHRAIGSRAVTGAPDAIYLAEFYDRLAHNYGMYFNRFSVCLAPSGSSLCVPTAYFFPINVFALGSFPFGIPQDASSL